MKKVVLAIATLALLVGCSVAEPAATPQVTVTATTETTLEARPESQPSKSAASELADDQKFFAKSVRGWDYWPNDTDSDVLIVSSGLSACSRLTHNDFLNTVEFVRDTMPSGTTREQASGLAIFAVMNLCPEHDPKLPKAEEPTEPEPTPESTRTASKAAASMFHTMLMSTGADFGSATDEHLLDAGLYTCFALDSGADYRSASAFLVLADLPDDVPDDSLFAITLAAAQNLCPEYEDEIFAQALGE